MNRVKVYTLLAAVVVLALATVHVKNGTLFLRYRLGEIQKYNRILEKKNRDLLIDVLNRKHPSKIESYVRQWQLDLASRDERIDPGLLGDEPVPTVASRR